jgi:hypothetical protein
MYKELPKTPAKTAFLHDLTLGVPCRTAATALSLDPATVSRAAAYSGHPWVEFQRQLGFPRDNRAESNRFLLDWLSDDANCPYPSGMNARCYTGSPAVMWAEYASASLARSIPPLQFDAFERVRSREGVQTRDGDIFINRDEVRLAELRAEIEEDPALEAEYEAKIAELEENLAFCKERKRLYREAHQGLQGNARKMVVTIDFTGTQTGMQDKFYSFVVVICTDQPLRIPPELADSVVQPEEPPMLKKVVKPVLEKKKRKTKLETKQTGGGRKLKPSFNQYKAKIARKPRLQQREKQADQYKPSSTVFHFVLRRGEDTPGQTSPYVQWSMDFLFLKHSIGAGFDEVHLFSDGCGKHFKTYPTHWYALILFILCIYLFISSFLVWILLRIHSIGTWPICNSTCEREKLSAATTITILTTCPLRI